MNQPAPSLSHRLRSETKEAHTNAERSGIMREVLRGTVSHDAYVALLVNLHALYEALERELVVHANHRALSGVNWHALKRTEALAADIAALGGADRPALPLEPATREYIGRLEQLGKESPSLLFAHAYLRYLGDLYGGQIMKRILQQAFHADGEYGFSFYNFDGIADIATFKHEFREAIDQVPENESDADAIVAEALRGYLLHAALFTELGSAEAAWRSAQLGPV